MINFLIIKLIIFPYYLSRLFSNLISFAIAVSTASTNIAVKNIAIKVSLSGKITKHKQATNIIIISNGVKYFLKI